MSSSETTTSKLKLSHIQCKIHGRAIQRPGFGCSECLQSVNTSVIEVSNMNAKTKRKDTVVDWAHNTDMMRTPKANKNKATLGYMAVNLIATLFLMGCIMLFVWVVTRAL